MSLPVKEKPCNGVNKAHGFEGCGKLTKHRKYGLGVMCCYPDWLMTTEAGKIELAKAQLRGKKIVEKKVKAETKEAKEKLKTLSHYQKDLEKQINAICRIIDKGSGCISCGGQTTPQAGHYHSVGSNGSLRFNLHNLHLQDYNCNCEKSSNTHQYDLGLIDRYGKKYWEYVKFDIVALYPILKLQKFEYPGLIKKASEIVKRLKANDRQYNPSERLEMRDKINLEIGIYNNEYTNQ